MVPLPDHLTQNTFNDLMLTLRVLSACRVPRRPTAILERCGICFTRFQKLKRTLMEKGFLTETLNVQALRKNGKLVNGQIRHRRALAADPYAYKWKFYETTDLGAQLIAKYIQLYIAFESVWVFVETKI